ncbi:unnamed protein product [Hermetia illucens]|uniref:Kazal-like domain-containing protein n=1 Tax=Hermetia illucens TaxID=343691 RepID=A0A7R8UQ51_HERIL|nr:enhancer of split M1 protein-like [Hermetia illucens]CAD7084595.1 unnamed protein product [Hermetia illucens]
MMKVCVFFLIVSISFSQSYPKNKTRGKSACSQSCLNDLGPKICGTDGENYYIFNNACFMNKKSCLDNKTWNETSFEKCASEKTEDESESATRCSNIICPLLYMPICATNGKSFQVLSNPCLIKMESCLRTETWLFAHPSNCNPKPFISFE